MRVVLSKVHYSELRTKNLDYNLLLLEVLFEKSSNSVNPEMRRAELLGLCQISYDEKYGQISGLGHNTFQRCLNDLEEDMAITIVKSKKPRYTIIKFDIERIKKLINDIKSQQGLYRLDVEVPSQEIEPKAWEQYLGEVASDMIDKNSSHWIYNVNEQSQNAHVITQKCASKIQAILVSSRFGFTLFRDGDFETISSDDLCQLALITSKIASKDLRQPFKLLIDFSGAPQEGKGWGPIWDDILSREIIIHFEVFAESVFKFKFTEADLNNLCTGHLDNLSQPAARCFDIFYDNYLLPYLKIIGSEAIKFSNRFRK